MCFEELSHLRKTSSRRNVCISWRVRFLCWGDLCCCTAHTSKLRLLSKLRLRTRAGVAALAAVAGDTAVVGENVGVVDDIVDIRVLGRHLAVGGILGVKVMVVAKAEIQSVLGIASSPNSPPCTKIRNNTTTHWRNYGQCLATN